MQRQSLTLNIRIRSTVLWTIMGVYSIFIFFVGVLFLPFKVRIRHKVVTTWTWVFNFCARNICGVKYEVIGVEYIMNTPAIIASNHQSMWETLCFSQIFPQHVWVLKSELLKLPFFGWALKISAPIAIDRSTGSDAMQKVLTQGLDRFKQGFWIMTFPEGTRLMPKERKKYKAGTARLAILLDVPILPVAHNAGYFYPKTGLCLYPGTVTVKICPPIYRNNDDIDELTERVEVCINTELDRMGA